MNIMVKHALRDLRIQLVVGLLAFFVAAGLGWWLYSSYRARINEQACFAFAVQLENLERLRQDPSADEQAWNAVGQDFAQAYKEYASSDLAPLYIAAQSEAALNAKKPQEAISLLEKALNAMGSSHSLYYLYKIKLQLMRLSSEDHTLVQEGMRELRALAEDAKNPQRGYAWYQLWHHAWVTGDEATAEEAFARLAAYQNQGARWGQLAQAKMEFLA